MTQEFEQALGILQGQSYDVLNAVVTVAGSVMILALVAFVIINLLSQVKQSPPRKKRSRPRVNKVAVTGIIVTFAIVLIGGFLLEQYETQVSIGIKKELMEKHDFNSVKILPEMSKQWIDDFRDTDVGSEIIVLEKNRVQYYEIALENNELVLKNKLPLRIMM